MALRSPASASPIKSQFFLPTAVGRIAFSISLLSISTVIESCRRRWIDPFAYLRDVFTRMPQMAGKDYATLAPAAWAKAHRPGKPEGKDRLRTEASDLQRRFA